MQLYAYDIARRLISSNSAQRKINYYCTECRQVVRLRGGNNRRVHFFHLNPNPHCQQSGKSLEHLLIQNLFLDHLPKGECILEAPFPQISRIADVFWAPRNLIFEIQCSPITAEEVHERITDYTSLGFKVVWVLHERSFNHRFQTAAERLLYSHPHFYTNIDSQGKGIIYDQYRLFPSEKKEALGPFPINFSLPKPMARSLDKLPHFIHNRLKNWPLYFSNDLVDLICHQAQEGLLQKIVEVEKKRDSKQVVEENSSIYKWILKPYKALFQFLLEKSCQRGHKK